MADLVTIQRWNAAIASATQSVIFVDDDDGNPYVIKKVFGARITVKNSVAATLDTVVSYALDGASSFVTTYVGTPVVAVSTDYQVIDVDFSPPLECQSIRLRLDFYGQQVYINDVSRELRAINRRVT